MAEAAPLCMSAYRLTIPAKADLQTIWSYISRDSPSAADDVEEAILSACRLLARNPAMGHVRKDLTKRTLRFWTLASYRKYIIVYDPETKPLKIIRILHGSRNLTRTLKPLR
jgi:antitoxin ParD1/3/4/toxin ParE1/3/4